MADAKVDRRDAYVLADGLRTDRRLFRRLHVAAVRAGRPLMNLRVQLSYLRHTRET